nr:MAG TPA: hypothetical protein [Bacteriophage sp.]
MANIITIEKNTLSSEFFDNINKNFEELNKETDYTQITASDISDGALTTSKIADDAITETKIKDGSVTASKLAIDSVNTEKIVNGTIQKEDLSEDLQVKLNNTKRIFVVSSMPTGTTITDINNQTITANLGDIVVLVKGSNG